MSFVWSHDENDTEYWSALSTLHGLILTCTIIVLLFIDYKQTYGNNLNPLNLNYDNK